MVTAYQFPVFSAVFPLLPHPTGTIIGMLKLAYQVTQMGGLTDAKVRNIKDGDTLSDGGNLFVKREGKLITFFCRYTVKGMTTKAGKPKRGTYVIGHYPAMGLSDARKERDRVCAIAADGMDPKKMNILGVEVQKNERTFAFNADEWLDQQKGYIGTSKSYSQGWLDKMEKHLSLAKSMFGGMELDHMQVRHTIPYRDNLLNRGYSVMKDGLTAVRHVFFHAHFMHRGDGRDIVSIHVEMAKRAGKATVSEPAKWLEIDELDELGQALSTRKSRETWRSPLAIAMLMHTWTRKMQVLGMRWQEINWKGDKHGPFWLIPVEPGRNKSKRPHKVHLSQPVIDILMFIRAITPHAKPDDYVITGERGGRMGHNTLNQYIETIGFKGRLDPHGARGTAQTGLEEMEDSDSDRDIDTALELQLAHVVKGIKKSYMHAKKLKQRATLLDEWSQVLSDAGINVENIILGLYSGMSGGAKLRVQLRATAFSDTTSEDLQAIARHWHDSIEPRRRGVLDEENRQKTFARRSMIS